MLGASDTRINVRSAPRVASGNIVASTKGGELLRVLEAAEEGQYTWYRVTTLPGSAESFEGWIRGDLLASAALPEPTLPQVLATPVPAADVPDAARRASEAAAPVPLSQRTDWSRDLLRLFPAIEGCAAVGSAPPITVLRAIGRSRGLAEIIMSDAAGRRWDCVIRETGGTPMRYDPLSGAVYMRDRMGNEPFFAIGEERPALDPNCFRFERVIDPTNGEMLGWLYYRTCP
ncbi:MAG: hypothetical protein H6852_15315 [Geminicoccaceae bacterium]|nr:hypothetical protein [Geminicoccaceae bacterium]MCB9968989.1 hypothetical protein [Geminicoccaceae bacterium]HRY23228.1 SH3 domain-containing protein [Geminicoccaceae bacterium]